MRCVRLAAAVINQTPLDWSGNQRRIKEVIAAARQKQVAVLCLPELVISGYGCEDAFLGMGVCERALQVLDSLRHDCQGMVVVVGLPLHWRGANYNVAAVVADTQVIGMVAKQHLAGDGLHYEPRWFKPWPAGQQVVFCYGDWQCPLGDAYFVIDDLRLGLEICEDAWVAQRPASRLAALGMDVICNPSASHFAFGKYATRQGIVKEGSRAYGAAYVYSNLLGNEAGRIVYDGGALIAAQGELLAAGPRFELEDWVLTSAVIDSDAQRRAQARSASARPGVDELEDLLVTCAAALPEAEPEVRGAPDFAAWEHGPSVKEESFTRAICLGLTDYVRKSRSRGFVISLSGGADSAAVLCLVALAWRWGVQHFGQEDWCRRLGLPLDASLVTWCTCVYQATANSGVVTSTVAADLAAALSANFHHIDVEELVQAYTDRVATMLGRPLAWEQDDIALQNIQARARAPGVWMLANCLGALLLSTSNRSEAAVGYATMDGDTCGGLSPIAGIDKAFLRDWLRWLAQEGPQDLGAIPALAAVNSLQPTAELRPQSADQTDEDDLMPYPVLDAIERLAIRDKYAPAECLRLLGCQFPDHDTEHLRQWVGRFFALWSRNQWKRERYAPSFHVDDENLDPKTWCRFPILSGGFRDELAELGL